MVSAIDRAKRALVTLLKSLATVYGLVLSVTPPLPATRRSRMSPGSPDSNQTTNSHAPDCSKKPRSAFEVGSDQGIRQLYPPIFASKINSEFKSNHQLAPDCGKKPRIAVPKVP